MVEDLADVLDPPRSRTIGFYVVLCFIVGPFWCTIPVAWIFCLWSFYSGNVWDYNLRWRLALTIALFEAAFSVYHVYLVKSISGPSHNPPVRLKELEDAFTRVLQAGMADLPADGYDDETGPDERPASPAEAIIQLEHDDPRAIDFRSTLRTWFGRRRWSEITLHQARQWLYWSIFNAALPEMHEIPEHHRIALDTSIEALQKRCGKTFPDALYWRLAIGLESPLRLTVDPVNINWRPLGFYVFVAVINLIVRTRLTYRWNFKPCRYDGLEYLLYTPEGWDAQTGPRPLVFLHGLGLGLAQYNHIISKVLDEFQDRPIFILLQAHISQDFFHPLYLKPLTRSQTTERLAAVMQQLGWVEPEDEKNDAVFTDKKRYGVTMLSHSNGSYAHAWMLKAHPEMVTRSCFVDPVTFCSWEGDVCYNFIYKPCTTALDLIMRYFVGTELGVANLLQRHFDWSSNALWYEEIPNARDPSKTLFLVGGNDAIVNAPRVKKYLTSHGVRKGLVYDPNGRHGEALVAGRPGREQIFKWLREHN